MDILASFCNVPCDTVLAKTLLGLMYVVLESVGIEVPSISRIFSYGFFCMENTGERTLIISAHKKYYMLKLSALTLKLEFRYDDKVFYGKIDHTLYGIFWHNLRNLCVFDAAPIIKIDKELRKKNNELKKRKKVLEKLITKLCEVLDFCVKQIYEANKQCGDFIKKCREELVKRKTTFEQAMNDMMKK